MAPGSVRTSLLNAAGGQKAGNTITWTNVGPIAPHASKTVPVDVQVAPDSPAGVISNHVDVSATCTSGGEADGMSNVVVPVDGAAAVDSKVLTAQSVPGAAQVLAATETNSGVDGLAATGAAAWVHMIGTAMALLGAIGLVGLRRLSRSLS